MRKLLGLSLLLLSPPATHAADIEAGKAKAASVCAACHGVSGVSVSDSVPNLAAQRAGYLETQLKAFKDGSRKAPIMNAIATQLSAEDVANVAAYFASLPGAAPGQRSEPLPHVAKTHATFPDAYKETFARYTTVDQPGPKQVRHFFANAIALAAAREGRDLPDGSVLLGEIHSAKLGPDKNPVTGPDGRFVPDQLVGYAVMARNAGWGKDIPEMLRNSDWNYAAFTAARQPRPGVNQAECFACHKPLDKTSYVFTLKQLAAMASSSR
jgi:cytochrome c553